jgi:hypothetical protein
LLLSGSIGEARKAGTLAQESAVRQLLSLGVLEKYTANAAAIQNRAVFEFADVLAEVPENRVFSIAAIENTD